MHLQAQVLPAHGIQEIEPDGEFRAKPRKILLSQKFPRLIQGEIHRRGFNPHSAVIQIQAVFLGNPVKRPGIVFLSGIQMAHLFHPLPAPNTGVKIRNQAEWPGGELLQPSTEPRAADHGRVVFRVGIQIEVHPVIQPGLVPVGNAPFPKNKIPLPGERIRQRDRQNQKGPGTKPGYSEKRGRFPAAPICFHCIRSL